VFNTYRGCQGVFVRVFNLGGTPLHTFEDYIKHNKIVVGKNISNDEKQFN
jgi:hypothetical protein